MSPSGPRPRLRLAPFWPALAVALAAGVLLWLLLPGLVRQGPGGAQRLDAFAAISAALALAIGGAGAGVLRRRMARSWPCCRAP